MSRKIKYTDEPLRIGEVVRDFLPSPSELAKRETTVRITLEVTHESLDFFKKQAKKAHVPYQLMIKGLIDAYAQHGIHEHSVAR